MAAETLTSDQAADTYPVFKPTGSGLCAVSRGTYTPTANVEDGDIFEMSKVPSCLVVFGWLYAADLDTGTEALDQDIGWAGNGTDAADPDGLGNLGTWTGDAVTGIKPETGNSYPFGGKLITDGSVSLSAETTIQIEANTAAGTFSSGHMTTLTFYTVT